MNLSWMTEYARENYVPVPECGCWLWLGAWHWSGYGKLNKKNPHVSIIVSRLFYAFYKGEIPEGMRVCHKCDTPACVNPDHLFLGSDRDNSIDRERKGRGRWKDSIPSRARRSAHKPYAASTTPQARTP